jgi:predicted Zn-ribbon and HTH transcriptional regulator
MRIISPRDNDGYNVEDDRDKYEQDREDNAVNEHDGWMSEREAEMLDDLEVIAQAARETKSELVTFMQALKRGGFFDAKKVN